MELEEQVMGIIINAGQSRSLCYEALQSAKQETLLMRMKNAAGAALRPRSAFSTNPASSKPMKGKAKPK